MCLECKLLETLDHTQPGCQCLTGICHVGALAWQLNCSMTILIHHLFTLTYILNVISFCEATCDPLPLPPGKWDPSFFSSPTARFHTTGIAVIALSSSYVFLSIIELIMSLLKTEIMSYLHLNFQAPSTMLHVYRITLHNLWHPNLEGKSIYNKNFYQALLRITVILEENCKHAKLLPVCIKT